MNVDLGIGRNKSLVKIATCRITLSSDLQEVHVYVLLLGYEYIYIYIIYI
jgi:hypothetical protein